jgi:4-amino-4-deoxy-L-arabinose transferase-like glycosyltransferase
VFAAELVASVMLRQDVGALALVLGTALVLGGMAQLVLREWQRRERGASSAGASAVPTPLHGERYPAALLAPALLLLVTLAGAWLRIHEIDVKTLTHTEGMLPNLAWPPDSWPPARHSFHDTFWWHFHSELHPPAHYLLMWGWTQFFGTSLTSLRLPSALFGIGSILVSYRIGALTHSRLVGLLAAALVAFNGFHIFNSQYARVYMMGTFLALLSTLSLLYVVRAGEHRRRWEMTYVLSSSLAIYTQTFFWIVLATQMAWVAIQTDRPERFIRRIIGMQALVVMVGASALAHQIYQGAPQDFPGPSLAFVVDYLFLGFAFLPDVLSIPPRSLPAPVYWPFAAFAILLAGLGSLAWDRAPRSRSVPPDAAEEGNAGGRAASSGIELSPGALGAVAVGSALVTLGFVVVALQRRSAMSATIAVPILALCLPPVIGRLRSALAASVVASRLRPWVVGLNRPASLVILLAFLPTLALLVISFQSSVLNQRAFMMFSSFLLILAAAGASVVGRIRVLRIPLILALVAVHLGSVAHWRGRPSESRDYQALAERMNERMQPGDFVFVVPREHSVTPLFYYLDDRGYTYVTHDYADAVRNDAGARVWLVFFESYEWGPFMTTTEEMTAALAGFRMAVEVEALRSRAQLFRRTPE